VIFEDEINDRYECMNGGQDQRPAVWRSICGFTARKYMCLFMLEQE
jgi:hypothetical protein